MITKTEEKYARGQAVNMLRRYICTKYEEDNYSDEKLIEDYIDIYNVAMDMFNYGLKYDEQENSRKGVRYEKAHII